MVAAEITTFHEKLLEDKGKKTRTLASQKSYKNSLHFFFQLKKWGQSVKDKAEPK